MEFSINVRINGLSSPSDFSSSREDDIRDSLATIVEQALLLAGYPDAQVGTRGHLS